MRLKTDEELRMEKDYWSKSDNEKDAIVGKMIHKKFTGYWGAQSERKAEHDAKYNLPYGDLVRAVEKTTKKIAELKNKPENLLKAERERLLKEYENLVKRGMAPVSNTEIWIAKDVENFILASDGEYRKAKNELVQAEKDLEIYLEKKAQWEIENADIIRAERIRTKRAELLQADPEALRALGIEPTVVSHSVHSRKTEKTADEERNAILKSLDVDTDALLPAFMERRGYYNSPAKECQNV